MTTADTIAAVFADLETGKIPDREALAELCRAWRRLEAGMRFSHAVGTDGPIAKAERNAALFTLAGNMAGGYWQTAGRIQQRLLLPPNDAATAAAVRLGARDLGRKQISEVLKLETSQRDVQASTIDLPQDETR